MKIITIQFIRRNTLNKNKLKEFVFSFNLYVFNS